MRSIYTLFLLAFVVQLVRAADDVFEADDEIVKNEGKTNIEQFISTKNLTTTDESDDLAFSTLLYTPKDTKDVAAFYATAVENLKKHAPKLRTISLFGGHTFYPEKSSADAIKEELTYSQDHLQALLQALKKQKVKVTSNVLTVMFVVDDKSQKASKFEEIVGGAFGKDSIVDDSNEDGLELLFRMEGADMHLYLVFINKLDAVKKTKLPFGRTPYARSITDYLDPIYDELEAQSKDRIRKDETKLFVPGVKRLNKAGELHLDEFYDEKFIDSAIKDTTAQDTLTHLVLSLGFSEHSNVSAEDFYKQAVKHLKEKAPKLGVVRLDGGYAFNPDKPRAEDIKNEVDFLKENMGAALLAFKDADIKVISLKIKVYWLSNKKDAEDSGYPKLIQNAFGYEPNEADIDSGRVLMVFQLHSVECDVELNFYDTPPKSLPHGRTFYYAAAKLHEAEEEKSSKQH